MVSYKFIKSREHIEEIFNGKLGKSRLTMSVYDGEIYAHYGAVIYAINDFEVFTDLWNRCTKNIKLTKILREALKQEDPEYLKSLEGYLRGRYNNALVGLKDELFKTLREWDDSSDGSTSFQKLLNEHKKKIKEVENKFERLNKARAQELNELKELYAPAPNTESDDESE